MQSCTNITSHENLKLYPSFKHSDDYWFAYQASRLPGRVKEPAEATVFIIPALVSFSICEITD